MTQSQQSVEALKFIMKNSNPGFKPEVGIILGTGISSITKEIEIYKEIPYSEIPHFPISTVDSHEGKLILGKLAGKDVVVMLGRHHLYEGYSLKEVTLPTRVLTFLCERIIITNACGALNEEIVPGTVFLAADYINLLGWSPLIGKNEFGMDRFPDSLNVYSKEMNKLVQDNFLNVQKGVYVAVQGPQLNTKAEYKMLNKLGGDVVGMSSVPEAIVANHMKIPVVQMSVVTDSAYWATVKEFNVNEIIEVAKKTEPYLNEIIKFTVKVWNESRSN